MALVLACRIGKRQSAAFAATHRDPPIDHHEQLKVLGGQEIRAGERVGRYLRKGTRRPDIRQTYTEEKRADERTRTADLLVTSERMVT